MNKLINISPRLRRLLRRILLAVCAATIISFVSIFIPLPRKDFSRDPVQSVRFFDRRGVLLRQCLNDGETHADWAPLGDISRYVVQAAIAVEDRRFYFHPGIDPLAMVRAMINNCRAMSLRAGGSTLTQQVIRNTYHHPRTILNKIVELWYALRLERMITKKKILEEYLNRVPFGNQMVGIEAASHAYFGKPSKVLSLGQAAFLVGLPNSPTFLNPRKDIRRAQVRQKVVLLQMLKEKFITQEEYERAIHEPLQIVPGESAIRAGHATDMVLNRLHGRSGIAGFYLTLDYVLQEQIQGVVRNRIASLSGRNVTNCAVVVVDNLNGEIRSLVGSVDYFDENHSGAVNGAVSLRQPGSAMKPLLYALAFEQGMSPADVIADIPTAIPDHAGEYVPENYDRKSHGPVRIRSALACSYNVPAVRVLQSIGKDLFLNKLRSAGLTTLNESPDYYGYGLTLGNGEVTLLELTNAYAAIANRGLWKPVHIISSAEFSDGKHGPSPLDIMSSVESRHIFDDRAAFLVTDILRDPAARRPAFGNSFHFPFQCAVKTGTTKDYRDNWTVGFTTKYTVGVWVGNFDGSPMHGVSGVTGAGQIFTDIMNILHLSPTSTLPGEFLQPEGMVSRTICTLSGQTPGKHCPRTMQEWFVDSKEHSPVCSMHRAFRVGGVDGKDSIRVYAILPQEYSEWSQSQRIQLPPPTARIVRDNEIDEQHRRSEFAILEPASGDCFKFDPVLRGEFQKIRVLASVPDQCKEVHLIVDGSELAPYTPSGVWWALQPGRHLLKLAARKFERKVESEPVIVLIE